MSRASDRTTTTVRGPDARSRAPAGASGPAKATEGVSAEERRRRIEEAAFLRAEKRGFDGGHAMEDWLDAEAEVDAQIERSLH
jgi:hypothetical protein